MFKSNAGLNGIWNYVKLLVLSTCENPILRVTCETESRADGLTLSQSAWRDVLLFKALGY